MMDMKRYGSLIITSISILILMISIMASLGAISDEKRKSGQNVFGGFGAIAQAGNPSQHYYYDDTSFYYFSNVPTWGHSFHELYTYNFSTGESSRVCKRVSCTHQSGSCPLHPLFQGENTDPNGIWSMIDHSFISLSAHGKIMKISLWNPFTDQYRAALNIPRYDSISDNQGMGAEYASFFNDALRITDDIILIGYNNEMHLFDNTFHELFYFPCSGLLYPIVTANRLFWLGMQNELNCVHLDTGEVETNMLKGLFDSEHNDVISVLESQQEFAAFAYNDEIYFPHNGVIYAFHPGAHSVREITEIDPLTAEDPYACFGTDALMFYKLNGSVQCMNLDTGAVNATPELTKVPCAAVREYLLFIAPDRTSADAIICWKRQATS